MPGTYSSSSGGGIGSPGHLVGEQFRLSLGPDLVHVPFNGANLAVSSVVAGHTPIGFVAPTPALPLVKDGKLRVLAGRRGSAAGVARCLDYGGGRGSPTRREVVIIRT
jgi:tripartite-type tricarboxylate transporter receptor subunit TctC